MCFSIKKHKTCEEGLEPNKCHKKYRKRHILKGTKEIRKYIQKSKGTGQWAEHSSAVSLDNTSFRVTINILKKKAKNFENK